MEKITIDQVRERLESTVPLSILPQVALKALSMVRSKDADIRRLERVVSHDQTLTAEILKVANSAFYNPSTPIKTLRHALVYSGLSATQSIILTSATRSLYKGKDEPYNEDLWKHSVASAIACRTLAKVLTGKAFVAMANIYCSTWGYSLNRIDFVCELENLEKAYQRVNLNEAQLEGLSEEIKAEMENGVEFFTL